jgi:hypothetical protein
MSKKIIELEELNYVAQNDLLLISDVSESTPQKSKKITVANLLSGIASGGSSAGSNLGAGLPVFKDVNAGTLRHRTIRVAGKKSGELDPSGFDGEIFLHPTPPGWFNVYDYGAKGDGTTDDTAAINATIAAAKILPSGGESIGSNASGGVVYFPHGIYRCTGTIIVDGSVTLQGVRGSGPLSGSLIVFDEALDIGTLILMRTGTSDGSGTSGEYSTIRDIAITQPRSGARNNLKFVVAIKMNAHAARCENIYIDNINGTGIEITGNVGGGTSVNNWSLSGSIRISRCDKYGIYVHGGDSNAGSHTGMLDLSGNMSWGLREASFLGNGWGHIHTAGNGLVHSTALSAWELGGGYLPARYVWTATKVITLGLLQVPSYASGGVGYYFIATTAGTTGASEPDWSVGGTVTIGSTVNDGSVVWQCWMEAGGPIWSQGANSPKSWSWIYMEQDQNLCQFDSPDYIHGAANSFGITTSSNPQFGPSAGYMLPFSVQPQRFETWDNPATGILRPINLLVGDKRFPLEHDWRAGFGYNAAGANAAGGTPIAGHFTPGISTLRNFWDERYLRWIKQCFQDTPTSHQLYTFYDWMSYSEADGRTGPLPGAVCYPSIWLGGELGNEARWLAVKASASAPYKPDFSSSTGGSAKGTVKLGDLVWNVPTTGRPSMPAVWRANAKGGIQSHNGWSAFASYPEGMLLDPQTAGNPIYRVMNWGTTGASKPTFANTPGQTYTDGTITWEHWGILNDESMFEPLIAEVPTMLTKSVAGGSTVTLTTDEAAYARIKLTGVLTANIVVIIEPGAALGWSKPIWNTTTGNFTITVKSTSGGTGSILPQGSTAILFSDTTDVRRSDSDLLTLTTTNATPTNIVLATLGVGDSLQIDVIVRIAKSDSTIRQVFKLNGLYYGAAGPAATLDSGSPTAAGSGTGSATAILAATGANIVLTITGIAATTLTSTYNVSIV